MSVPYKILASVFLLAFFFATYWGEIVKPLVLGILFTATIWIPSATPVSRVAPVPPRLAAIILVVFAVISVGFFVGLQLTEHPLLSAALGVGFYATVVIGKTMASRTSAGNSAETENIATDSDEACS